MTNAVAPLFCAVLAALLLGISCEIAPCCVTPEFVDPTGAYDFLPCQDVCITAVRYSSMQSCAMVQTCKNVMRDWKKAMDLLHSKYPHLFADPADDLSLHYGCDFALKQALCAFHFPGCIMENVVVSRLVCEGTCSNLELACNITLPQITPRDNCATRNFACNNDAVRVGGALSLLVFGVWLLSLLFVMLQ